MEQLRKRGLEHGLSHEDWAMSSKPNGGAQEDGIGRGFATEAEQTCAEEGLASETAPLDEGDNCLLTSFANVQVTLGVAFCVQLQLGIVEGLAEGLMIINPLCRPQS